MKYLMAGWLTPMVCLICTAGCSTLEPTPDAVAAASAHPWGGSPPKPPDQEYPWAGLVAGLLNGIPK